MTLIVADKHGRELPAAQYRRADQPQSVGGTVGLFAGREDQLAIYSLPGGAALQFDLSRLTLRDFRVMRDHYQINASLSVLTFMLHQIEWHIECDDKKIESELDDQIRAKWTQLIRGLSQAFWAGYSPCVLEYDNNVADRRIELAKVKDLIPEECEVNWKITNGDVPAGVSKPKVYTYNGISQRGWPVPIAPENTLWYPLLMENGNYYGKKLLKPAFPSWFFSMLIHLFANRYFERFGEPLPIGRAPFGEEIDTGGGVMVDASKVMETVLTAIRSRAVTVLPSDRDPVTKEFDYQLEYLESAMRGADFEKYLSRLDEEMSLGMFTPVLLFRTGETGSYNLGTSHLQTFLWMLNALANDLKEYLDEYVVERLKGLNFSVNAPRAQWCPRKLGKDNLEIVKGTVAAMIQGKLAKADLEDLSELAGIELVETTTADVTKAAGPQPPAPIQVDPRAGLGRPERTTPPSSPNPNGPPAAP